MTGFLAEHLVSQKEKNPTFCFQLLRCLILSILKKGKGRPLTICFYFTKGRWVRRGGSEVLDTKLFSKPASLSLLCLSQPSQSGAHFRQLSRLEEKGSQYHTGMEPARLQVWTPIKLHCSNHSAVFLHKKLKYVVERLAVGRTDRGTYWKKSEREREDIQTKPQKCL